MPHRALFALLLLASTTRGSEPITTIPLGSHDNTLVLAISNASTAGEPSEITVEVTRAPQGVIFHSPLIPPSPVGPGKEVAVTLSFDVAADLPPGLIDTVGLTVRAATGETWSRTLLWRFTGPDRSRLDRNHPNPFNPSTTIPYSLALEGDVSLAVFDRLGRLVRTLVAERKEAGEYSAVWDGHTDSGSDASSGVYYCRLRAASFSSVIPMLLLK